MSRPTGIEWRGPRRTHLVLDVASLIITVRSRSEGSAGLVSTRNTTSLCEVLLAFCPADLDLLLLAAAAEFIRLESALRFECRATVLWNVAVGHVEDDAG